MTEAELQLDQDDPISIRLDLVDLFFTGLYVSPRVCGMMRMLTC